MSKVVPLSDAFSECNNPEEYMQLSVEERVYFQNWIDKHIRPYRTKSYSTISSYQLKHLFEQNGGFYITNGQMKGAMLVAGFKPKDTMMINWTFQISKRVIK